MAFCFSARGRATQYGWWYACCLYLAIRYNCPSGWRRCVHRMSIYNSIAGKTAAQHLWNYIRRRSYERYYTTALQPRLVSENTGKYCRNFSDPGELLIRKTQLAQPHLKNLQMKKSDTILLSRPFRFFFIFTQWLFYFCS